MNKLYPIGTHLITHRISQAAFAYELGFLIETKSTFDDVWVKEFYRIILNPRINPNEQDGDIVCKEAEEWRVTITEENQQWLSPVPMVGDWVETFDGMIQVLESAGDEVGFERKGILYFWENEPIVLRTYLNGQRAPLLEWDEVILPQQGASS